MASFGSNSPFGDRGSGGGRENGRRALPGTPRDVVLAAFSAAHLPLTAAAATTTTTTTTSSSSTSSSGASASALGSAPVLARATASASTSTGRYFTRSQVREIPDLVLRTSATPAPAQPRPRPQASSYPAPTASTTTQYEYPALETLDLQPWTFRIATMNNIKLTQLLRYRALAVNDELWWNTGTYRQGLRIIYIGQGGRIYLHLLDNIGLSGHPFIQDDGTPYFMSPEAIIDRLRNNGRHAGTGLTPWNALELFRGGHRLGTLNEVREDFRVRGSQQRRPARGRRTAVAAPAPAPATAAEDTTETAGDGATAAEEGTEVAVDERVDVEPWNERGLYENEDEDAGDDAAAATAEGGTETAGNCAAAEEDKMDVDSDWSGDTIPYPDEDA